MGRFHCVRCLFVICYHSGGMNPYSIGVDLGGTNLRAAAINSKGAVLDRVSLPAMYDAGPLNVVNDIVSAIKTLAARLGDGSLLGVGIGVPGFIDMDTGVVIGSANLPGFQGFPVRDEIQKHLGIPIILENDANAAALGEKWMGAGQNVKDLILLTLGTGIGGGVITDGKILHGSHGMAGEFGHMTVFPDGNPCGCGNTGCLEKHASATAVAAMGRMMHFGQEINTAEDVFNLALAGQERARWVFEAMGRALGIALASLINVFNFPLYLLSGGPLPAWDFFAPSMLAEVHKRSFTFARTGTRIEKAMLGADAGLFGAAYLPLQQISVREIVIH
jgi:glucokinase